MPSEQTHAPSESGIFPSARERRCCLLQLHRAVVACTLHSKGRRYAFSRRRHSCPARTRQHALQPHIKLPSALGRGPSSCLASSSTTARALLPVVTASLYHTETRKVYAPRCQRSLRGARCRGDSSSTARIYRRPSFPPADSHGCWLRICACWRRIWSSAWRMSKVRVRTCFALCVFVARHHVACLGDVKGARERRKWHACLFCVCLLRACARSSHRYAGVADTPARRLAVELSSEKKESDGGELLTLTQLPCRHAVGASRRWLDAKVRVGDADGDRAAAGASRARPSSVAPGSGGLRRAGYAG